VATFGTFDGSVAVMRDGATGMVTFLPADPADEWRVLEGDTLATYANGEPATVFVFHPPFDAWAWLDYWYGFDRADVEAALAAPAEPPLVRGDELGLPPGPQIGQLLARIDEERAAGVISTREEALELARREAKP
jgi:hypothetical protein